MFLHTSATFKINSLTIYILPVIPVCVIIFYTRVVITNPGTRADPSNTRCAYTRAHGRAVIVLLSARLLPAAYQLVISDHLISKRYIDVQIYTLMVRNNLVCISSYISNISWITINKKLFPYIFKYKKIICFY